MDLYLLLMKDLHNLKSIDSFGFLYNVNILKALANEDLMKTGLSLQNYSRSCKLNIDNWYKWVIET